MKPAVFDIVTNTPQKLILRMRWFPPVTGMLGALLASIPCIGMAALLFPENPLGQLMMMAIWCVAACMMVFNAETLTITCQTLSVCSAPIPWVPWQRPIATAEVHSIACECTYLKGQRYSLRIYDSGMESVIALSGIETEESCRAAAQLVAGWILQYTEHAGEIPVT